MGVCGWVFYVEYLNGHETDNPFGEVGSQYSLGFFLNISILMCMVMSFDVHEDEGTPLSVSAAAP